MVQEVGSPRLISAMMSTNTSLMRVESDHIDLILRETQHTPKVAYPRHPLSPPNDSGFPNHKLLGQGGERGMLLSGSVGKFLD